MRIDASIFDDPIRHRVSHVIRRLTVAAITATAALTGFTCIASMQAAAQSSLLRLDDASRVSRIAITLNKSETLRFSRPYGEALAANPDYADVTPLTDRSLYIIGKKIGQTRITVLDTEKKVLGVVDVEVGFDVGALQHSLREDGQLAGVKVRSANGRILLSGLVSDAPAQARAISIAEQYAPGAVSTSMSVRASQQVMLAVRFVEVDRTAARDLGVSWDAVTKSTNAATGANSLFALAGLPSGNVPFGQAIINVLSHNGSHADLIIQALEKRGLARRLAEPNHVTLSGDTANFLAGGEFPYAVLSTGVGGVGTYTVEFKKFGIGLAFTPTVLAAGQINLKIEPEVSDLDFSRSITLGANNSVPSLSVRRASATIELRDGQSFAMAGLLENKHTTDQNQLPWIGQVPVLGALFRSASYQKSETDLVIIVTPHLVKPAIPGQPLETPLDQKVAGNDIDYFLLGRAEREKDVPGPYGHILDVRAVRGWNASAVLNKETEGGYAPIK